MTDDDIVDRVLQYEGGFVNNPLDRGGPTNFGITASELGRVRNLNRAASAAEVQALTRSEAVAIYKADYIAAPKFASIADPGLRMIVVDSGVMHGVGRATKWLQQALGVAGDGQIGPETLDALSKTGPATVRLHRLHPVGPTSPSRLRPGLVEAGGRPASICVRIRWTPQT